MKALSIQQPFAWLIVHGHKAVENRTWTTAYRGPLLIHAGKSIDYEGLHWVRREFPAIELPKVFDLGGIVGQATLVRTVHEHDDNVRLSDWEARWFVGRYGFVLRDAKPLPFRAVRGQLGLFEVPDA